MRSFFSAALAVLLFTASAWGAGDVAAIVSKITGKAQLQQGSDWVPLTVGQKLSPGDTVSTGFRSELQLQIGPSTVTVKALSRMTLRGLSQNGTEVQTDLYLKVGKVDAEVNKSEAVTEQKFKVSSPVATASVRGTAFSFDTVNLQVTRGIVDFSDVRGNQVSVPVGESARASLPETHQALATSQTLTSQNSVVQADAGSDYGVASASADSGSFSYDGYSYSDILSTFFGYNWYGELPNVHVYIGGIGP